tara:strand:+ start:66 stop:473 length:408 start_codon:yes stop_codon:yes gene_type:complete
MAFINKGSEPLENFTEEQLANLGQSIKTLDQEDERWNQDQKEENEMKKSANKPFRRLRKSPVEIFNRLLFFFFLASFLFSFISVYTIHFWWFIGYLISAFSCILYPPNRKALKELIDAWPNIEDLIKNKRLWKNQ